MARPAKWHRVHTLAIGKILEMTYQLRTHRNHISVSNMTKIWSNCYFTRIKWTWDTHDEHHVVSSTWLGHMTKLHELDPWHRNQLDYSVTICHEVVMPWRSNWFSWWGANIDWTKKPRGEIRWVQIGGDLVKPDSYTICTRGMDENRECWPIFGHCKSVLLLMPVLMHDSYIFL